MEFLWKLGAGAGLAISALCVAGIACQVEEQSVAESKRLTVDHSAMNGTETNRENHQRERVKCVKKLIDESLKDGYPTDEHHIASVNFYEIKDDSFSEQQRRAVDSLTGGAKEQQRHTRNIGIGYYSYKQYTAKDNTPDDNLDNPSVSLILAIEDDVCYCLHQHKDNMSMRLAQKIELDPEIGEHGRYGKLKIGLTFDNQQEKTGIVYDEDTDAVAITRVDGACDKLEISNHNRLNPPHSGSGMPSVQSVQINLGEEENHKNWWPVK